MVEGLSMKRIHAFDSLCSVGALLLGFSVSVPTVASADELTVPVVESWQYDEARLLSDGFGIDVESLIQLATGRKGGFPSLHAITTLGGRRERLAIPALKARLHDRDASWHRATADALIRLGETATVRAAHLSVMNDPTTSASDRLRLAGLLAAMGDVSGFHYVVEAIQSQKASLRYASADVLVSFVEAARSNDWASMDPCLLLQELTTDQDPLVRTASLRSFPEAVAAGCKREGLLSTAESISLNELDAEVRKTAEEVLESLKAIPADEDDLQAQADMKRPSDPSQTADPSAGGTLPFAEGFHYSVRDLLGQGIGVDVESLMTLASGSEDPARRWKAVNILGGRRERLSIPVLKTLLESDASSDVRRAAAVALARLGEEVGFGFLHALLHGGELTPTERLWIVETLATEGDAGGLPYLREALSSRDRKLRIAGIKVLPVFMPLTYEGQTLAADPCLLLIRMTEDKNPEVRREAVRTFLRAEEKGCPWQVLDQTAERLAEKDGNSEVRELAARILASMRQWRDQEPSRKEPENVP